MCEALAPVEARPFRPREPGCHRLCPVQHTALAGVAVDVLATELTDIKESPLRQTQEEGLNTIITPHIAGATWDAMWATEEFLTEHILSQAP